MHVRTSFTSDPGLYGIKRENFVSELTPWNHKEKVVCRIGPDGPLFVHICRGELMGKKKDGWLYYCVRVFWGGEFNADFKELSPAFDYANCRTNSDLARVTRLAAKDEYPSDMPGLIGTYIVGGSRIKGMLTESHLTEIVRVEENARKKRPCPACGSFNVIPICCGKPAGDATERERRGEIELRDCVVGTGAPAWRCKACLTEW